MSDIQLLAKFWYYFLKVLLLEIIYQVISSEKSEYT